MKKYFLESKTAQGKGEISLFHQFLDESLSEALDCFHDLVFRTPTQGFSEPIQLNIFIDGLRPHSTQHLDVFTGGKIKLKTPDKAMKQIDNVAASDHAILWDTVCITGLEQLETLTKTLSKLPQHVP